MKVNFELRTSNSILYIGGEVRLFLLILDRIDYSRFKPMTHKYSNEVGLNFLESFLKLHTVDFFLV